MSAAEEKRQVASFTIPLRITVSFDSPALSSSGRAKLSRGRWPESVEGLQTAAALTARFSRDSLAANSFTWETALSLALASQLAYASRDEIDATAIGSWGLSTCQFIESGDTQCFLATTADVALVAFRGTESVADWLADLNARSLVRPYGAVHRGFYHAFRDAQSPLQAALDDLGTRSIVLTGHSLGGALATVAAAEWCGTRDIRSVYTYGQPRCGNHALRSYVNQHVGAIFNRFVNDDDIVTRVPPGFRHVGRLFHFDADGELQDSTESIGVVSTRSEQPPLTETQFDQLRAQLLAARSERNQEGTGIESLAAPELEGFFPSFSDHKLAGYVDKIMRYV